VLAELARRAIEEPGLLDCFARVMLADVAFEFTSAQEFEDKARESVLRWAPALAGKSFHVRLRRRGFKGRLNTPREERLLDDVLLAALAAAETPAEISFDDPDAVIDVETVGNRAAMSLLTREDLRANPFLRAD
jgi:tRNA(Ser,Leu) C12 N-acetylase TAN1